MWRAAGTTTQKTHLICSRTILVSNQLANSSVSGARNVFWWLPGDGAVHRFTNVCTFPMSGSWITKFERMPPKHGPVGRRVTLLRRQIVCRRQPSTMRPSYLCASVMQLGNGRCRWALISPRACLLGLLQSQSPEASERMVAAVYDRREVKICKSSFPRRIMLPNVESKLFSYLAILI
jgi:hypothetical protein